MSRVFADAEQTAISVDTGTCLVGCQLNFSIKRYVTNAIALLTYAEVP